MSEDPRPRFDDRYGDHKILQFLVVLAIRGTSSIQPLVQNRSVLYTEAGLVRLASSPLLWRTLGARSPPSGFFGFLCLTSLDITRILRLRRLLRSWENCRRRTRNPRLKGTPLLATRRSLGRGPQPLVLGPTFRHIFNHSDVQTYFFISLLGFNRATHEKYYVT
jgi:hypothetical protein